MTVHTHSTVTPAATPTQTVRAYLGGSFDPVHQGHIQMALHVHDQLAAKAANTNGTNNTSPSSLVALLPNARSPFKSDTTAPEHRLAMLTLATQHTPLHICDIELWQPPPVYTIDTVKALRQRHPQDSLIFIMGADSAATLASWHHGLELTQYVHLWIFPRGEHQSPTQLRDALPTSLHHQLVSHIAPLQNHTHGRIYIDTHPIANTSSTQLRAHFQHSPTPNNAAKTKNAGNTNNTGNPNSVGNPNTPAPPADTLVNPSVSRYIKQHQLYANSRQNSNNSNSNNSNSNNNDSNINNATKQ